MSPQGRGMRKQTKSLIIRASVSFLLIGYFLMTLARQHGGLGKAVEKFSQAVVGASLIWLIFACALHLVGYSLGTLRWRILIKAQGFEIPFRKLFRFYFMAGFLNNFLPSTIGGDALRAIESKQLIGKTTTSVVVVVVERITGMLALMLISFSGALISMFTDVDIDWVVIVVLAACFVGFLLLAFIFHPRFAIRILPWLNKVLPRKIYAFLEKAYDALKVYYKTPSTLLKAIAISILYQMNMVLYYFLIASSLHQYPNFLEYMIKVPLMIILLMVVPAINGIGVRTASFKELMNFTSARAMAGESFDLVMRFAYGLLGGLMFMFYRRSKNAKEPSLPKK